VVFFRPEGYLGIYLLCPITGGVGPGLPGLEMMTMKGPRTGGNNARSPQKIYSLAVILRRVRKRTARQAMAAHPIQRNIIKIKVVSMTGIILQASIKSARK
jgi:hypothetical protein